jgi:hypothetical protein
VSTREVFPQILRTQVAWTRTGVLAFAVGVFVIPSLVWRLAGGDTWAAWAPFAVIQGFSAVGPLLGGLALLGGMLLAALPWTIDAETRHVYPLSLPVPWSRYVMMRYAAGALTLLAPALALYLGGWFVLLQLELPDVLRAYPGTLAIRFLLATLVSYSATFTLQYVFGKSAAKVVLYGIVLIAVVSIAVRALGGPDVVSWIGRTLFQWPGPFAVFAEPWKLIDV